MKKIFTTILACSMLLLSTSAFAQLAIHAGYVKSTLNYSWKNTSSYDQLNNGFELGVDYNFTLLGGNGAMSGEISFNPGVTYTFLKGSNNDPVQKKAKEFKLQYYTLCHYVSAPLYLNFAYNFGDNFKVFAYAGPTLDYRFNSKSILRTAFSNLQIKSNEYENSVNKTNVLIGGGVGFELLNLRLTAGYDYGLRDLQLKKETNAKIHRSQVKVQLALVF